ncbi:MAG: carboxypeptidase-like regulatory domain-containing protein, partial [Acidobacteriota bacterium]
DVTEDQVVGFKLVAVDCVETSSGPPSIKNSTVDLTNRKARIIAEEGESIVCTFTSDEMSATAGEAAITGRVVNANGMGIRGVRLTLFNASTGEGYSAITNSFGFYSFDGLDVQNFYVLTAMETKLYRIPNPTRSFTLSDNLAGLDFMVGPPGRW